MLVANFALYMRTESKEARAVVSHEDMKCFAYDTSASVVTVRIATSLISSAQVGVNMKKELPVSKGFDALALEAKMVWNK